MDLRAADSGIEFLVGVGAGTGIFSMVHSSLWSAQNFGDNPESARSCLQYGWVAAGATVAITGLGSAISRSVWPLLGGILIAALMLVGYRRALAHANGTVPALEDVEDDL